MSNASSPSSTSSSAAPPGGPFEEEVGRLSASFQLAAEPSTSFGSYTGSYTGSFGAHPAHSNDFPLAMSPPRELPGRMAPPPTNELPVSNVEVNSLSSDLATHVSLAAPRPRMVPAVAPAGSILPRRRHSHACIFPSRSVSAPAGGEELFSPPPKLGAALFSGSPASPSVVSRSPNTGIKRGVVAMSPTVSPSLTSVPGYTSSDSEEGGSRKRQCVHGSTPRGSAPLSPASLATTPSSAGSRISSPETPLGSGFLTHDSFSSSFSGTPLQLSPPVAEPALPHKADAKGHLLVSVDTFAATVQAIQAGRAAGNNQQLNRLVVLDSRYKHEFQAGHVRNAHHVKSERAAMEWAWNPESRGQIMSSTVVFVHCEFSSIRGPAVACALRGADRSSKAHGAPLKWPHVYVVQGGMAAISTHYPELLEGTYLPETGGTQAEIAQGEADRNAGAFKCDSARGSAARMFENGSDVAQCVNTTHFPLPSPQPMSSPQIGATRMPPRHGSLFTSSPSTAFRETSRRSGRRGSMSSALSRPSLAALDSSFEGRARASSAPPTPSFAGAAVNRVPQSPLAQQGVSVFGSMVVSNSAAAVAANGAAAEVVAMTEGNAEPHQ